VAAGQKGVLPRFQGGIEPKEEPAEFCAGIALGRVGVDPGRQGTPVNCLDRRVGIDPVLRLVDRTEVIECG
jgi:hypothetical protein